MANGSSVSRSRRALWSRSGGSVHARVFHFALLLFVLLASSPSCMSRNRTGDAGGSPPVVHTRSATSITLGGAAFGGEVDPHGTPVEVWFEYGTDPALSGSTATSVKAIRDGSRSYRFRVRISGLQPYTTYYYRAMAGNGAGTRRGDILSFPTGDYYVVIGDSITRGPLGGGYASILRELLQKTRKYPIVVANRGVTGVTSREGEYLVSTTLASMPQAKYYLVMFGTNDASDSRGIPSGKGKNPGDPGYSQSYKGYLQRILSAILAAGKAPYLAKVPYSNDPSVDLPTIREYNEAIDELVAENRIGVTPPDFYAYFRDHPDDLVDGIHPNRAGYAAMANLWFEALTGQVEGRYRRP